MDAFPGMVSTQNVVKKEFNEYESRDKISAIWLASLSHETRILVIFDRLVVETLIVLQQMPWGNDSGFFSLRTHSLSVYAIEWKTLFLW